MSTFYRSVKYLFHPNLRCKLQEKIASCDSVFSMRRILVLCISTYSVKKAKQLLIMKIWIWCEKQKPQKFTKPFPPRWIFQIWCTRLRFLNLGFCSIFFKFWQDYYSVLVGRHTMFRYFLVKSDLCQWFINVRSVYSGYTVLKRMPNIKITTKK